MIAKSGQRRVRCTIANLTEGRTTRTLLSAAITAAATGVTLNDCLFAMGTVNEGSSYSALAGHFVSDEANDTAVTIDAIWLVFAADGNPEDIELVKFATGTGTVGTKVGVAGSNLQTASQRAFDTLALTATTQGQDFLDEALTSLEVTSPADNTVARFRAGHVGAPVGVIVETAGGVHYLVAEGRAI